MTRIMRSEYFTFMYDKPADAAVKKIPFVILFFTLTCLLAGCAGNRNNTTRQERAEPWFCEINESRESWECVQDEALARTPRPKRLPNDPVETAETVVAENELTPATETIGIANPSAAIDFETAAVAIQQGATLEPPVAPAPAVERDALVTELMALPGEHLAVQLAAVATRPLAEAFQRDHELEDSMILELANDDDLYYVVLMGTYSAFEDAQAAVDGRPESLEAIRPWIRPLEAIQSGIRAAEAQLLAKP
ncbi:MAG: hypothetical protein AAGE43_19495 [Pseudomonadota bacterium]